MSKTVHCVHIGKNISSRGGENCIAVGRDVLCTGLQKKLLLFPTVVKDVSLVTRSKKSKYRLYSNVTCGEPPPAMFGFTDNTSTTFPPTHQLCMVPVKTGI